MIKTFRHKGLKRLFENDDPRGVRADQVVRLRQVLDVLDYVEVPSQLALPGWRLHALKGNSAVIGDCRCDCDGRIGITISGNWRLVFRMEEGNALDVDLVEYH